MRIVYAEVVTSICIASGLHTLGRSASDYSGGHPGGAVRVIDASGVLAAVGLLQIRSDDGLSNEFGSVCGANAEAAAVVCKMLGYSRGMVASRPCASYGGSNLCGATGSPVAMMNLTCVGGEMDIRDCTWTSPIGDCLTHALDTVLFCAVDASAAVPDDGALRLISYDGAPSIDAVGRLEIYDGGAWGSVCSEGFSAGSAAVACKQMGFVGSATPGSSQCSSYAELGYCSEGAVAVSHVSCTGAEQRISECGFEAGADVFCAPNEAIVLACVGEGVTHGPARKVPPPRVTA